MSVSTTGSDKGSPALPKSLSLRLATALGQAAALYLLTEAATKPLAWPATQLAVFVPMLLVAVYAPLVAMQGCTMLPLRALAIWVADAAILLAALGFHAATRGDSADSTFLRHDAYPLLPRFALWLAVSVFLFVAHVLVIDSVIERRFVATYRRHFDTAWKLGLQAGLSLVFVGVFWGILELGAGLFRLVDLKGFSRLLLHDWFSFPATTLALAVSIHATDVQPALVRGARSILLALFSWLLPLLAAIIGAFLCCLPLISLRPLWNTHFAASLLLIAAADLIFLINACYQDGDAAQAGPIKRIAARVGALELLPLLGLAVWALGLRVAQHGWTVDRIYAAGIATVLISHALGYAAAAVWPGPWLKRIEITNFASACLMLALILLLFSPAADPARLMVASQLGRLKSGAVSAQNFDFHALRLEGARWGWDALKTLAAAKDPDSAPAAARAQAVLALPDPRETGFPQNALAPLPKAFDPAAIDASIIMFPAGRTLPPHLYQTTQDATVKSALLACATQTCVGHYASLRAGAPESLILILQYSNGAVLDQAADGSWHETATVVRQSSCTRFRTDDLKAGAFALQPDPAPDIVIGSDVFKITPFRGPCP
jgi:hypothetical protein